MQHSRFTEQQIAFVLDQVARGASVEETCRKAGIPAPTYYRWRAKYAGLKPAEIRRLHEIEDENRRLKRLLAALLVVKPAPGTAASAPAARVQSRALVPVPSPASTPASTPMAMNRHWQSLSAYLPKRDGLAVRLQPRAFLKRAREWTLARSNAVRRRALGDVGTGLWGKLLKTWRVRKVLVVCFAAGLIGGFAMGLAPTTTDDDATAPVPVNMNMRANSYGALSSAMDKGWGRPESWGRWMEGGSASLLLGFDGPARGDVELLVEGRARLAEGQPQQTLIVRFNGAELGRWRLPEKTGQLRRRFIVPKSVFNQSTAARLTFDLANKAPLSAVFGLEAVSLRDARFLHEFRGFVDTCTRSKLTGWAVAEGTGVSVVASANGEPLKATLSGVERPDLAPHGLPDDAGFELTLAKPVAAGSAVDVRFANGRPLSGSPCTPTP